MFYQELLYQWGIHTEQYSQTKMVECSYSSHPFKVHSKPCQLMMFSAAENALINQTLFFFSFFFPAPSVPYGQGNFVALLCCMMCTVITYAKSMPLMNEHWVCVSSR